MKLSNNPNDYRRYIKEEVIIKEKKVKIQDSNSLNDSVILEEEKCVGYCGITTNLNGNKASDIHLLMLEII